MTVELKTENETFLAVKVPEDAKNFAINLSGDVFGYSQKGLPRLIDIPEDTWQLIGACKDITEEQWADLLPRYKGAITGYRDYEAGRPDVLLKSATESGLSLLTENKVYLVNPFKDGKPSEYNHDVWYSEQEWQEAEERTGNWILIKKNKS